MVEATEASLIILITFKEWDSMLFGSLLLLIIGMEDIMGIGEEIFID